MVPMEYGTFTQTINLTIWDFQFITGITFKWDYVMWHIIALMVWIGRWAKLRIYKVPPRPSQMVLQRFWIYMESIHAELDAMDQEQPKYISQEASQCSPQYEVGDILDEL